MKRKEGNSNESWGINFFKYLRMPSGFLEHGRLIVDAIILGFVGAFSALLFVWLLDRMQYLFLDLIAGYQPPGLPHEGGLIGQVIGPHGLWLIPLVTTVGGLISGILVYSIAPEAEGHGTDTAVKAFHNSGGYIRPRVTPLKLVASAITLGSGGSAGREGPTALFSSGIGSIYASLTKRTDRERRLLILMGMAAGLSAIFRSPIGTALFAVEVLYADMEFEDSPLLYLIIAAVTAYAINGLFVGYQPLFSVPSTLKDGTLEASPLRELMIYAVLGVIAGGIATIVPCVFYGTRDAFHKIPLPPHVKPAIGGLGVGLLAMQFPQVLGGGYGWIQHTIDGQLAFGLLLTLVFAKLIAFSLTVSSGGSGGVFAPTLFIGAMLGGALAQLFHQQPAALAVVGMAAVFAGAARVPMSALFMVIEMTGGYQLLVSASLAVALSFIVQTILSRRLPYTSLYEAQVPSRTHSPAHHLDAWEATLRLIQKRQFPKNTDVDLHVLLTSGVPVRLPDNRYLNLAVVSSGSDCVGKPLYSCFPPEPESDVIVVAVLHGERVVPPHTNHKIQAGDSLLVISPSEKWDMMQKHFLSTA